ncbi:MAG: glycosyltransferase family 9 protein [Chloroflexi bacterium]|nr:glycosyltransferase family 9 protein [Chloroflexota bacterium]
MCGPALRALRAGLPDARIVLWASPGGGPAAGLLEEVDDVFITRAIWQDLGRLPFDPERERSLIADLARPQFDGLVIFTSFAQSPFPAAYVGYLAGIPLRAGQSREFGGAVLTDAVVPLPDEAHQVDRNLRLVEELGFSSDGTDLRLRLPEDAAGGIQAQLAANGIQSDCPLVLLHPGASCPSRTYPVGRYAEVARLLRKETGWSVIVTGVERERSLAEEIVRAAGAVSLAGQTTLPELAALVARARLVICNNTSVMHLADALRAPLVVLFAGTELVEQWQPRGAPARLLRHLTPCSPCYAFECRYQHECLDVSPAEVVGAALGLLNQVTGDEVRES